MIGRRSIPDGLPFRLYERIGKRKVSYGYKLPDGTWEFRLSAPVKDKDECARIRREAIERANKLNGITTADGETARLIQRYFDWQYGLPVDSERRKAENTLKENEREAQNILKVFRQTHPGHVRTVHIYKYLDARAEAGAPAKGNKEIALFSSMYEYWIRLGAVETNPCRGIKYNKTRPRQRYVTQAEIDYMVQVARELGGSYFRVALCLHVAYMTVSRPDEMRSLMRQSVTDGGIQMTIGKRKKGYAERYKLIQWSDALRIAIIEALALQRTVSMYVFGNNNGQVYSRSGFNTILKRLMDHCRDRAEKEGIPFSRFTLADMRPAAVTDRVDRGDTQVTDATGHMDDRMVQKVYDRRKIKQAKSTK